MKNIQKFLIFSTLLFGFVFSTAQKITTQAIDKPTEGKSLVYILKTGAGAMLNFRIYDKDIFLGPLSGYNYLVYECEPGPHVFWAASENRDYVEADLQPNGVYVLNAEGQMGAFIASVSLKPLNPTEFKDQRLFFQMIKHGDKKLYVNNNDDKSENIKTGLEKYADLKTTNSKKIKILENTWKFENADKPVKK